FGPTGVLMFGVSTPPDSDASPAPNPGISRLRRVVSRLMKICLYVLAAGMAVQILLVTTPAMDRLYGWLIVTQDPQPADVIVCLGGHLERLLWTVKAYNGHDAPAVVVSNAPGAAEFMRDVLV